MKFVQFLCRVIPASCLVLVTALSLAWAQQAPQQPANQFEPTIGQEGKDVIWVPTSDTLVEMMLDMAEVTAKDIVFDLGSGDGRSVIAAAKRGATALGVEYNADMVALARRNAEKAGVADKAKFVQGDIFETDFSRATVLFLYLLPDLNMRLRPIILNMKPGVRVVSNSFDMDDWAPDNLIVRPKPCPGHCTAFYWIVPAKVEGKWAMRGGELVLRQRFQKLSGTFKAGNNSADIKDGKMTGDLITFAIGDMTYTGRVNGKAIEGTSTSTIGERKWEATRTD